MDDNRAGSRPPEPDFFIVGTPRSGTTLLAAILSSHEGVYVVNDSFVFETFANQRFMELGGLHRLEYKIARRISTFIKLAGMLSLDRVQGIIASILERQASLQRSLCSRLPRRDSPVSLEQARSLLCGLLRRYSLPFDDSEVGSWIHAYLDRFGTGGLAAVARGEHLCCSHFLGQMVESLAPRPRSEYVALGEKTPVQTRLKPWMASLYPEAKFVYLVRNPFSSISALKVRRGNISDATSGYLELFDSSGGLKWLEPSDFVVRYEDVIYQPERTLPTLYDYLGIAVSDTVPSLDYKIKASYVGGQIDLDRDRRRYDELSVKDRDFVQRIVPEAVWEWYPDLETIYE